MTGKKGRNEPLIRCKTSLHHTMSPKLAPRRLVHPIHTAHTWRHKFLILKVKHPAPEKYAKMRGHE